MANRIDLVGMLFYLWGGFQVLVGGGVLLLFALLGGGMFVGGASGGDDGLMVMGTFYVVIALVAAFFVLLAAIPSLAAGYGLRGRKSWAKVVGIVAAVLAITSVPLGTALAVFALVVLMDAEASAELAGGQA